MREQAALSENEITADKVSECVTDPGENSEAEELSDYSKGSTYTWEKILMNVVETPSSKIIREDILQPQHSTIQVPKVNGNRNKHMQHVSLMAEGEILSQGNGVTKMILGNIPMYKEVLPGLQSWHAGKVASWHNYEGHSIQWFCVVCIDRTGESFFFSFSFSLLVIAHLVVPLGSECKCWF